MKLIVMIFAAVIALVTPHVATVARAEFAFTIRDTALNKLASRIGPLSDAGQHDVTISYPCFVCEGFLCWEGYWTTCTVVIFSAAWSWTISGTVFDVSPAGLSYRAALVATYGFLTYSTEVAGAGDIGVAGNRAELRLSSLSIPIGFEVPGIGFITVTTINRTLPYQVAMPVESIGLNTSPPGGTRTIGGTIADLSREYRNHEVVIKGRIVF